MNKVQNNLTTHKPPTLHDYLFKTNAENKNCFNCNLLKSLKKILLVTTMFKGLDFWSLSTPAIGSAALASTTWMVKCW